MNYFDLHCDTLGEKYRKNSQKNVFQLDPVACAAKYEKYSQVFAIYSSNSRPPDENFDNFLSVSKKIRMAVFPSNLTPYISVEGGNLLDNHPERLKVLKDAGVCILTPVWGKINCLGGAHDTNTGITEYGKQILTECLKMGIVTDLSHSSDKFFYEAIEICQRNGKTVLATHSNSRTVCSHSRNLTDDMFRLIVKNKGVVGISLCPSHLTSASKTAKLCDVIKHIEHYLALGGENTVAFGCDYDGIETTPEGLSSPLQLEKAANELARLGYKEEQINKLFFENAERFFSENNIKSIKK